MPDLAAEPRRRSGGQGRAVRPGGGSPEGATLTEATAAPWLERVRKRLGLTARHRNVAKPLARSWPRGRTKAIAGLAGHGKEQPRAVHARCSQRATPPAGRGNSGTCLCGPAVVH
jgi:hypothetical protein